jgi:hypothetical protein
MQSMIADYILAIRSRLSQETGYQANLPKVKTGCPCALTKILNDK